jgi:outer membrane protein
MKNLKSLLLIAVFTLGVVGVSNAQKVGHIDFQQLIEAMPQTKELKSNLEKLSKTYEDDIDGMAKKIEATQKKYIAESQSQTLQKNDERTKELQAEIGKLEQLKRTAYQDIQTRQNDALKPIIETAQKAIEEVAAAKSILYVLDASVGKGLLVKKGEDIYSAVKTKLGF